MSPEQWRTKKWVAYICCNRTIVVYFAVRILRGSPLPLMILYAALFVVLNVVMWAAFASIRRILSRAAQGIIGCPDVVSSVSLGCWCSPV